MSRTVNRASSCPVICLLVLLAAATGSWGLWWYGTHSTHTWTAAERVLLQSLHLDSLQPLPPDPGNQAGDNALAARMGHLLFFDTRLSANGEVACATCHQPRLRFTDGLPQARALGQSARNTQSIVGAAWSPWFYWDGRKDSQWAQALSPLEDPVEHGSNRMRLVRLVVEDPQYLALYADSFGTVPDLSDADRFPADAAPGGDAHLHVAWQRMDAADQMLVSLVFANIGKALAAYQRLLQPGPSRFDAYVAAVLAGDMARGQSLFNADEAQGLRLFIGAGRCIECHNGPLFTNNEFHNTGLLPAPGSVPDQGRSRALALLTSDPFNCSGTFSKASAEQCLELTYMRTGPELVGAMRTPSLRNLGDTAPYMHKGQFWSLREVLAHYNDAPLALIGHNEAEPLGLSKRELRQLEDFLRTLDAALATAVQWLVAPQ